MVLFLVACGPTTSELKIEKSEPFIEEDKKIVSTEKATPEILPTPENTIAKPIIETGPRQYPTNIKDPQPVDIDPVIDIVDIPVITEPVIPELDSFTEILKKLPSKGNIAKNISQIFCQSNPNCRIDKETAKICDQSLSTQLQIEEYRNLLTKRNPDSSLAQVNQILERHTLMRSKRCTFLTHKNSNNYEIISNQSNAMILFVESCPGIDKASSIQFDCDTKSIAVDNTVQTIKLATTDRLILLSTGTPINGIGQNPYSHIGSSNHFWLEPHAVPALRNVRITQPYLGSFSHKDTYAVDFNHRNGETVASSLAGVIVTNNVGSQLYCSKGEDSYFRIYKNNRQVTKGLIHCQYDCKYSSFPSICHSANAANRVLISHTDNTFSSYMHLDYNNPHTQFGDVVNQGESIANIGLSGWVNGAHLHFEVQQAITENHKTSFTSIPIYFKSKYQTYSIYPDTVGTILEVPLSLEQIDQIKNEWNGKQFRYENLPGDSGDFNCKTRFAEIAEAPPNCHFQVTGSAYWHPTFNTNAVQYVANIRANNGAACLKEILGDDISIRKTTSLGNYAQERTVAEQKTLRSIQIDIFCDLD